MRQLMVCLAGLGLAAASLEQTKAAYYTFTDLGTLCGPVFASGAWGINDSGQVVGRSDANAGTTCHAFLYSDGVMLDLNDLIPSDTRWEVICANGINATGQIVGDAWYGTSHACLLTPTGSIDNGDFEGEILGRWLLPAKWAERIIWNGNAVLQLTTGSSITVSQSVKTPEGAFSLAFDHLFEQELGVLDVTLAGEPLATITSQGITGEFLTSSVLIDDRSLWGAADADLQFTFHGPESGLKLLLDNVTFYPAVPEPSTLALLSMGALALTVGWWRRKRAA